MNTFLADSIQFKSNPAQVLSKFGHDAKGIAPYFETYFKETNRNIEIASSLEMLQQVWTWFKFKWIHKYKSHSKQI